MYSYHYDEEKLEDVAPRVLKDRITLRSRQVRDREVQGIRAVETRSSFTRLFFANCLG